MEAIKFVFGDLDLTNEVINRLAALGYTTESLKEAINKHEQTNGSEKSSATTMVQMHTSTHRNWKSSATS